MYFVYSTRPNIAFTMRQFGKYNADSRKRYLQIAKKIVWYLNDTIDINVIFGQKIVNCLSRKVLP